MKPKLTLQFPWHGLRIAHCAQCLELFLRLSSGRSLCFFPFYKIPRTLWSCWMELDDLLVEFERNTPHLNNIVHFPPETLLHLTSQNMAANLVPRSRGWAKPKARSGQVRKFDFFDWLFQNMAVTALKFARALRGFSGPQGNSMSVFMQSRHYARNHNICILGTFRCLQSASRVKMISSQFFIAL